MLSNYMPFASREERIQYLRNWRREKGLIKGSRPKQTIEERRAYHRKYCKEHSGRVAELARAKQQRLKTKVMAGYGGKCQHCPETMLEMLTLDHVNDDGVTHRAEVKNNMYRWAIKNNFPPVLQCLCFSCNVKKSLEARLKDGLSGAARTFRKQRSIVLQHYGNKCSCCGEDDPFKLAIDHVAGGGSKMRKVNQVTNILYSHIIKAGFPPDYRVLCHNCNHSARMGNGVCTHQRNMLLFNMKTLKISDKERLHWEMAVRELTEMWESGQFPEIKQQPVMYQNGVGMFENNKDVIEAIYYTLGDGLAEAIVHDNIRSGKEATAADFLELSIGEVILAKMEVAITS